MTYNDYPCEFYSGNNKGFYDVATAGKCPINQLECNYGKSFSGCHIPLAVSYCPIEKQGPHCELDLVCNEFPSSPIGPYAY